MLGMAFSLIGGKSLIEAGAGILKALIDFFKTPVGQVVGLGLLVIGAYVGGKTVEHHTLTIRHKAEIVALNAAWLGREKDAAAAYETARQTRDREIAERTRAGVAVTLATLQASNATLQQQVEDYARTKGAAACRISDDLVRRRERLLGRPQK